MTESVGQLARGANIIAGIWLFISAFVLPHESAQFVNTWILGVLAVAFALLALGWSSVRYLNTLLAIWLFISAFALPHLSNAPVWNNAIMGIIIFVLSLVPPAAMTRAQEAGQRPQTPMGPPQHPQTV